MSSSEKNKMITELECDKNFCYVLNNNSIFSTTDYKVLQSQSSSAFVNCIKQLYNGKTSLYYVTEGLRPIEALYATLDKQAFLNVVGNLIDEMMYIDSNGFLSCSNINLSIKKIYVDETDMAVKLIYLPIHNKLMGRKLEVEQKIRLAIYRLIDSYSNFSSEKAIQLSNNFVAEGDTTQSLHSFFEEVKLEIEDAKLKSQTILRLLARNVTPRFELVVNRANYVIGKNASVVDGAITFNRAISRIHCKITKDRDNYYIMDLGSSNGTFVNDEKLKPSSYQLLQPDDIVRLADAEFIVKI